MGGKNKHNTRVPKARVTDCLQSRVRGGPGGIDTRMRVRFRALFQPGKRFRRRAPHVRALDRLRKEAQTHVRAKCGKMRERGCERIA